MSRERRNAWKRGAWRELTGKEKTLAQWVINRSTLLVEGDIYCQSPLVLRVQSHSSHSINRMTHIWYTKFHLHAHTYNLYKYKKIEEVYFSDSGYSRVKLCSWGMRHFYMSQNRATSAAERDWAGKKVLRHTLLLLPISGPHLISVRSKRIKFNPGIVFFFWWSK